MITASLVPAALVLAAIWLIPAASPGGQRPSLTIVSPGSGARAVGKLRIAVRVPEGTTRVSFYVDGRQRFRDRSAPWRFRRKGYMSVRGMRVGRHVLLVRARQEDGGLVSRTRVFYVGHHDSTRPSVAFRLPRSGQTVSGKLGSDACEAVAADRSGIDHIDFFLDGRRTRRDHKAPFRCSIDSAVHPNGAHTLMAKAYDRAGNASSTSAALVFENADAPVEEPPPEPSPSPGGPPAPPLFEAGFESGLKGWSTGGAGDAVPSIVSDVTREGSKSAKVILTSGQTRSELILAHPDSGEIFEFRDGETYFYGFSFYIVSMDWGHPGAHNLLWQLHQRGTGNTGSPPMGLSLVDYQGKRGLWTHSTAMGGARFLRALNLRQWYDVIVRFTVSDKGKGSYDLYLEGLLIDSRSAVNTLVPGFDKCMIQTGLYRNADQLTGTSEIRLDSARLGTSLEQVGPR